MRTGMRLGNTSFGFSPNKRNMADPDSEGEFESAESDSENIDKVVKIVQAKI